MEKARNYAVFPQIQSRQLGISTPTSIVKAARGSADFIKRLGKWRVLTGHDGCVNTIAWNQSGEKILSGSDDCHLHIYDVGKNKLLESIRSGHRANIFSARFLPSTSDRKVISCCGGGMVHYNELGIDTYYGQNYFNCHSGTTYELTIIPGDPNSFLTCGEDGTVRHFDLRVKANCKCQECRDDILIERQNAITSIMVNPLLPFHLAVGCEDSYARIYDMRMISTIRERSSSMQNGKQNSGLISSFKPKNMKKSSCRVTSLRYNETGEEILVSYSTDYVYLFSANSRSKMMSADLSSMDAGAQRLNGIMENEESSANSPSVKRLRLRGDWSDTGPHARPENEQDRDENSTNSLMQRISDVFSRWLDDTFNDSANRSTSDGAESEEDHRDESRSASPDVPERSSVSPPADSPSNVFSDGDPILDEANPVNSLEGLDLDDTDTRKDVPCFVDSDTQECPGLDSPSSARDDASKTQDSVLEKVPVEGDLTVDFTERSYENVSTCCCDNDFMESYATGFDVPNGDRKTLPFSSGDVAYTRASDSMPCVDVCVDVTKHESQLCQDDGSSQRDLFLSAPGAIEDFSDPKNNNSCDCLSYGRSEEGEGLFAKDRKDVDCGCNRGANRREIERKPKTDCPLEKPESVTMDETARNHVSESGSAISKIDNNNGSEVEPERKKITEKTGFLDKDDVCCTKNVPECIVDNDRADDSVIHDVVMEDNNSAQNERPFTKQTEMGGETELGSHDNSSMSFSRGASTSNDHSMEIDSRNNPPYINTSKKTTPGSSTIDVDIDRVESSRSSSMDSPTTARRAESRFEESVSRESPLRAREIRERMVLGNSTDEPTRTRRYTPPGSSASHVGPLRDISVRRRHAAATRIQRCFRLQKKKNDSIEDDDRTESGLIVSDPLMCYKGHRNARTMIKEANFWGDRYIISGSDCGRVFIWDRQTAEVVVLLEGDKHVVNCVQPHPFDPVLATSGIDYDVKVWAPVLQSPAILSNVEEIINRNEQMLEESRDTITVPASFMLRMLASLSRVRGLRREELNDEDNSDNDNDD